MAKTNHGRVGDALELLNRGLRPFVERELQAVYGDQWEEMAAQTLREDRGAVKATRKGELNWDTHNLLTVMWDQWNAVFRNALGHTGRSNSGNPGGVAEWSYREDDPRCHRKLSYPSIRFFWF